jgi:ComF family protein
LCDRCRNKTTSQETSLLDGLLVISPYQQASLLQKTIEQMKYHHGYPLARILGTWMASHAPQEWISQLQQEQFLIVAVPLHPKRYQERGFNQAELLAHTFARLTKLPYLRGLERIRDTPPQAQLSRNERLRNVVEAFSYSLKLPKTSFLNKKFILIDDVCSTGATLNACAAALKAAGANEVWGLVLARGSI